MPRLLVEAELRQRDPQFGSPAGVADERLRVPHRVEPLVDVRLIVLAEVAIEPHAGGADAESVGVQTIAERVERDKDVLGLILDFIAAAQGSLHGGRAVVKHARADVQRVVLIQDPDFHAH